MPARVGRQSAGRLDDHRDDRRARADQSIFVLSVALLDPPLASGVVERALVLAALLLAAEDEKVRYSCTPPRGVAKANYQLAAPNAG